MCKSAIGPHEPSSMHAGVEKIKSSTLLCSIADGNLVHNVSFIFFGQSNNIANKNSKFFKQKTEKDNLIGLVVAKQEGFHQEKEKAKQAGLDPNL